MWVPVILGFLVLGAAYIRLAPTHPDRWHATAIADKAVGDHAAMGQFHAVRAIDEAGLERLFNAAEAWPRTQKIAGGLESGRATYVTRTRIIGFPDYTTIRFQNGQVDVFARLRFGLDDLGVNKARVLAWLKTAEID